MLTFVWVLIGVVGAYLGNWLVGGKSEGLMTDIIVGSLGASAGNYFFNSFASPTLAGLGALRVCVAVVFCALALTLLFLSQRRIGSARAKVPTRKRPRRR